MQHHLITVFFFIATGCSHPQTGSIADIPEETADGKSLNIDVNGRPANAKEFYLFNNGMIILLDDELAPAYHQHIEVDSSAQF